MTIILDGTTGIDSPNDTTGNQSYTGTLTGGTGVVNLGSGQFYKDASGNVGIGVTPANYSGLAGNVLQGTSFAILPYGSNQTGFATNAIGNGAGGLKYANSFAASDYIQDSNHQWRTAPVGTTGNNITFTNRMILTNAGNLGVGTTSPATKLVVESAGNGEFRLSSSVNSPSQTHTIRFSSSSGATFAGGGSYIQGIQGAGIDFYGLALGVAIGSATSTEVVRITPLGAVGVNTTTPNANLAVIGSFTTTSGYITPTLTSGGFNINASATYNDNSLHLVGNIQNQSGILYIRGNGGTSAIPFWANGGGGVAYQWSWILSGGVAISGPSGTSIYTQAGSGGSTFTLEFSAGSGNLNITRTSGSAAYTVYLQFIGG